MKKMSKKIAVSAALTLIVLCVLGAFLLWQHNESDRLEQVQNEALALLDSRDGEYDTQSIVLHNTSHSEAKQLAERFGAELRIIESGRFATLTLPEGVTIRDIYAQDENKSVIEQLSPDFHANITDTDEEETNSARLPSRPQYTVSDTAYSQQTYLDYLNLSKVWNTTKGSGVTVAIIDTGIDTDHPEFAGRISEYSYNATEDKIVKDYLLADGSYDWSLVEDQQGHGTAVAGVIAASMDGSGTVGIAPNVNILVIKAECNANGGFLRTSDLVFGLYYAIERDADVVNMSFGGYDLINPFAEATRLAVDSDVICVAAAGNDATTSLTWPAADENVISVGALANGSWELAAYSNYGENSDIVAPGTTYTTKNDGTYKTMDGTSFACPNVVGGIALYLSQHKYATFEEVRENIYASCYDLGDLGEDWYYGYGAFDINALVLEERGTVTFNMLTDELDNIQQLFVRHHTLQDLPEPERTYAVFDGWYYDIECTEPLNYYADAFSADLTLYAKWVNEDDGVPYTYVELDDGTIEIRSYTGKRRYITMPEYIDGKVVSSIGDFAFAGQSGLREVTLPAQLKRIGMRAFSGCNNLVSITIPDTVTSIGEKAFMDNIRLSAVAFGADSQLTEIGSFAFQNCAKLTRFEIPEGVTALDGSAFVGTSSMQQYRIMGGDNAVFAVMDGVLMNAAKKQIIAYPAGRTGEYSIPQGFETIGVYAFAYAKITGIDLDGITGIGTSAFEGAKLESLAIPDSVVSLGTGAFANNMYLKTVSIGSGLQTISAGAFAACYSLESLEIPANIQIIGAGAFAYTGSLQELTFSENSTLVGIDAGAFTGSGLEQVSFPKSLVYIGGSAFKETALTDVAFEEESLLQVIGESAFAGSCNLSAFELPDGLTAIGAYAFKRTALTEVTLPASVTSLGAGAYASCHSLENIFVDDANTAYLDIDGVVYTQDKTEIVAYPAGNSRTSYTIDSATTTISESAFHGSAKLNYVYLPANLIYIERYALTECSNLRSISIPDSVYQISNYAFAYDWNLANIHFTANATLPRISYGAFAYTGIYSFRVPASVSTMAQGAFEGCFNLSSITFAANSKLESISAYMFKGCEQLTSITFENGSQLSSIQAHGLEGMINLTNVNFGDAKITNIDNYAFRYCESLQTLSIPNGVEYIGRYAFYGCKGLTRLDIPATIDYIGENAFYFAENLDIYFAADSLPANLAHNWDNGIRGYYVGVKNVIENDNWKYAELNGGGISIIEYKGSTKTIDLTAIDFGGNVVSIGGYAFYGSEIENITLPATLKEIHRYAFAFTKLKTVSIPDSVTFIGQYAFLTSAIEQVSFGVHANIATIEQYAFANTKNLETVKLPASLTTLGKYAFYKSGLESVDFSSCTLTTLPEGAFMETGLTAVTLPDNLTLIDHNAFRDCVSLASVKFGSGQLQLMSNVFYNTGLTEVYIPNNLTYIGEYSFVGLEKLTAFTVSDTHEKYTAIDGLLYSKDGRKLIAAPAGKTGEITLPKSLEVLGFGAFENSKLTKISFHPDSNILTFGYRCFYNAAITELNVPKTVVSFDFYAFAMCKNLRTVTFAQDNNLRGIYEGAFYGCRNLENIVLPDSIVEISDYAFYGCTALERLPISETSQIKGIYDYAFADTSFEEVTLPGTLMDIGNYAFRGAKLTSVTVPDDNKKQLIIGIGAFEDCNNLEEITLPFIGASFEDYDITWFGYIFGAGGYEANNTYVPESLKAVTISEGISFIGIGAFYELINIETVNFPSSISSVFDYSFLNTKFKYELTHTISFYSTDLYGNACLNDFVSNHNVGGGISGRLDLIEGIDSVYISSSNLEEINIPNSVRYFNFSGCNSLTAIHIPNGVTEINGNAFYGCTSLTDIEIPSSVTSIGGNAFLNSGIENVYITDIASWCKMDFSNAADSNPLDAGAKLYLNGKLLTDLLIPEGVSEIGNGAFYNYKYLNSITIPNSVTNMGNYSFVGCTHLYEVINNSSLQLTIGSSDNGCVAQHANIIINNDGSKQYQSGYDDVIYVDTEDGFKFSYLNGKYQLVAYFGEKDTVTLPLDINGETYELYKMNGVKNVVIPEGITNIGEYAFYGSNTIESISVSSSVEKIGIAAFRDCSALRTVVFEDNSKLTHIGDEAFRDCGNLSNVEIPYGTQEIGEFAFQSCDISNIEIPNTVTRIESYAFGNCDRLSYVYIPESVTYIGVAAFANGGVKEITIAPNNQNYSFYEGVLYNKNKTQILYALESITSVNIPEGVTQIDYGAFRDCNKLESITIPSTVTNIGYYAFPESVKCVTFAENSQLQEIGLYSFDGCKNLDSIVIPEGVTKIGNGAFQQCTSLSNVELPSTLTYIDNWAFSDCVNLNYIKLPEKLSFIGNNVFHNTNIDLDIDGEHMYFTLIDGVLYDKNITSLIYASKSVQTVIIPEGVTEISARAFQDCKKLTNVIIPNGVTTIKDSTFSGCNRLVTVSIPNSVEIIESHAFNGCSMLFDTKIPDGVTSMGDYAFSGCSSLLSINIPNGIINIGVYAFANCNNLTNVIMHENSKLTQIGQSAFYECDSLTSIEIPTGVTNIGTYAFGRCNRLYEVINKSSLQFVIGESNHGAVAQAARIIINSDGSKIFKDDANFTYIDTTDGFRFSYYDGKYQLIAYLGSEEIITLPLDINGNVYEIYNICGVKNVIIPNGMKSIGNYAFTGCTSLKSIEISSTVTSIGLNAFNGCKNLEKVIFAEGSSLTTINGFSGCSSLTNINIPNSVTDIGNSAFSGCSSLTSIKLPSSLLRISHYAFERCANLSNIEIPESITYIGKDTFLGTSYYNNVSNWENGCLYIDNHLISVDTNSEVIVVKKETGTIAMYAFEGCYRLKSLTIGGNHSNLLSSLTNLETLILTELPTVHYVSNYFGYNNIPLTLKTIVLRDGCNIRSTDTFTNISGVNIYVETDKMNVQWDHDFVGWNNGNRVYYGGEWIEANFYDADGSLISCEYYTPSQVIRQPYVENIADGTNVKTFVGWDLDGDGLADTVPATSASHIQAYAVYQSHRPGEAVTVPATCTEDGYTQTVCLDCGEIIAHKIHKALGHTSAGLIETVAPTCLAEGYERHTCLTCGLEYHTNFTSALAHTFGQWVVDSEASCEAAGAQHRICSECQTREDEVLPRLDHTYTAQVTKPATCTQEGTMLYTCETCGNQVSATIEKTEHRYEKHYASKSFIRWLIEFVLNIVCGYEGEDSFYYKCADCHAFMTYEDYATLSSGSSVSSAVCDHTPGDWTTVRAMSCLDDGVEVRACTKCNQTLEARIVVNPHKGHDYDAVVTPPTAGSQGYTTHTCTRCGDSYQDSFVPALVTLGDTDGNEEVNSDDAIYLLKHTLFPELYPINQTSDFDGNGELNSDDAIYLLKHTLFPDMYPLQNVSAVVLAMPPRSRTKE